MTTRSKTHDTHQGTDKMEVEKSHAPSSSSGKDEHASSSASMTDDLQGAYGVAPHDEQSKAEEERLAAQRSSRATRPAPKDASHYVTSDKLYAMLGKQSARDMFILGRPENSPIYTAKRSDYVSSVAEGMDKHNISSVPVLTNDGKFSTFIEVVDIVRYINNVVEKDKGQLHEKETFLESLKGRDEYKDLKVSDLLEHRTYQMRASKAHEAHIVHAPVLSTYMALSVIDHLIREPGVASVAIVNDRLQRAPVNLVTRSQVNRWLVRHLDSIGSIKDKPVSMCTAFIKEVLTIGEDEHAVHAFETMVAKRVRGLAVVDKDGKLIGNISLRDIKAVGHDLLRFWRLDSTVKNFLIKVRHEVAAHSSGVRHKHAIYVHEDATIEEVMQVLKQHKIHHVYICDKERKCKGVVSLRPLLEEIFPTHPRVAKH